MHDIWPGNLDQVDRDLGWLRERGVTSPALFVVPLYHGQRPIDKEPAFLDWLRERKTKGAEIFMHGFRHLRPESLGEPVKRSRFGKWINGRVRNEGEFAGLEEEVARVLFQKGFEIFAKSSLEPTGFAMPTWWGRISRNFSWPPFCRFFDGRFYVGDRITGLYLWAPALTFGSNAVCKPFVYGGAIWVAYLHRTQVVRIAVHPGDLEHEDVRQTAEKILAGRKAASYSEVLG